MLVNGSSTLGTEVLGLGSAYLPTIPSWRSYQDTVSSLGQSPPRPSDLRRMKEVLPTEVGEDVRDYVIRKEVHRGSLDDGYMTLFD